MEPSAEVLRKHIGQPKVDGTCFIKTEVHRRCSMFSCYYSEADMVLDRSHVAT
jgi:hypothetical protein